MEDVDVIEMNSGPIESRLIRPGIFVTSVDFRLVGELNYTCPRYFNARKSYVVAMQTMFVVRCETCHAKHVTFTADKMNVKWRETSENSSNPINVKWRNTNERA